MSDIKDKGGKKTVLKIADLLQRKARSVTAVFAIAGAVLGTGLLSGCEDNNNSDDDSYEMNDGGANADQYEIEDVSRLNDYKTSQLVQGEKAFIDTLVAHGETREQATKTCAELTKQARVKQDSINRANNQQNQNYNSNYNSNNDAMFWYLVGRNHSPCVYYGNSSSGLNYLYGGNGRTVRGASTISHLNPTQATFLHTPETARAAVVEKLSNTPGIKTVRVSHVSSETHYTVSESHGSESGHPSFHSSTHSGGFGGHGIGSGG